MPFHEDTCEVVVMPAVIDFGEVAGGTYESTVFLKNVSNHDVLLVDVIVSCGCISVGFERKMMHPAEIFPLNVIFDSDGTSKPFKHSVYLLTSAREKMVKIEVIGNQKNR